jgi:hypothetical protein
MRLLSASRYIFPSPSRLPPYSIPRPNVDSAFCRIYILFQFTSSARSSICKSFPVVSFPTPAAPASPSTAYPPANATAAGRAVLAAPVPRMPDSPETPVRATVPADLIAPPLRFFNPFRAPVPLRNNLRPARFYLVLILRLIDFVSLAASNAAIVFYKLLP